MRPFLLLCLLLTSAAGFEVTVDAYEKSCFYEDLEAGTTFSGSFEVMQGGDGAIDLQVSRCGDVFEWARVSVNLIALDCGSVWVCACVLEGIEGDADRGLLLPGCCVHPLLPALPRRLLPLYAHPLLA